MLADILKGGRRVMLTRGSQGKPLCRWTAGPETAPSTMISPVMHARLAKDGTIQGMLERNCPGSLHVAAGYSGPASRHG